MWWGGGREWEEVGEGGREWEEVGEGGSEWEEVGEGNKYSKAKLI